MRRRLNVGKSQKIQRNLAILYRKNTKICHFFQKEHNYFQTVYGDNKFFKSCLRMMNGWENWYLFHISAKVIDKFQKKCNMELYCKKITAECQNLNMKCQFRTTRKKKRASISISCQLNIKKTLMNRQLREQFRAAERPSFLHFSAMESATMNFSFHYMYNPPTKAWHHF